VHANPVPATVLMMLPSADTLRTRLLKVSAIKKLPSAKGSTSCGTFNDAPRGRSAVAARVGRDRALRTVAGHRREHPGRRHFSNPLIAAVGDQVAAAG
jgi:hypothetical protein